MSSKWELKRQLSVTKIKATKTKIKAHQHLFSYLLWYVQIENVNKSKWVKRFISIIEKAIVEHLHCFLVQYNPKKATTKGKENKAAFFSGNMTVSWLYIHIK